MTIALLSSCTISPFTAMKSRHRHFTRCCNSCQSHFLPVSSSDTFSLSHVILQHWHLLSSVLLHNSQTQWLNQVDSSHLSAYEVWSLLNNMGQYYMSCLATFVGSTVHDCNNAAFLQLLCISWTGLCEFPVRTFIHSCTRWGQLGMRTGEAVRVVQRGACSAPDTWTWTWTPTDARPPACVVSC